MEPAAWAGGPAATEQGGLSDWVWGWPTTVHATVHASRLRCRPGRGLRQTPADGHGGQARPGRAAHHATQVALLAQLSLQLELVRAPKRALFALLERVVLFSRTARVSVEDGHLPAAQTMAAASQGR